MKFTKYFTFSCFLSALFWTFPDSAKGASLKSNKWMFDHIHMTPDQGGSLGKKVTVAVIDTGFDTKNSGFKNIKLEGFDMKKLNQDINPHTLVVNEQGKYGLASHGTHVAGIVAQVAGQAIGTIKGFKLGAKSHSGIMNRAFNEIAKDKSISVVNISYGIHNYHYEGIKKLLKAGKVVTISAGNDQEKFGLDQASKIVELAKEYQTLLFVGALGQSGKPTSWSAVPGTKEASKHFIFAPGYQIDSYVPMANNSNGHQKLSGTSMASPVVAGVITNLMANFPKASAKEIVRTVLQTADPIKKYSCGIVYYRQAHRMLSFKTLSKEFPTIAPHNIYNILKKSTQNGLFDLKAARSKLIKML
jgi:subtilisin family serine protease